MPAIDTGSFTFTIPSDDLARGLRPSKRSPRNTKFLTMCTGAVGLDNVLQVLSDLNLEHLIDSSGIIGLDPFPYPQLFVFTNMILVCTETDIYEYTHASPGTLTHKINVPAGILWSGVEYYDYIYMSNCTVAVVRSPLDGGWSLSILPAARAMCNNNGQIVISPCEQWGLGFGGAGGYTAYCIEVHGLSINPVTMLVTGSGTGVGTGWQVVNLSTKEVMDSGLGTVANFSFTGEYGVNYELQYF